MRYQFVGILAIAGSAFSITSAFAQLLRSQAKEAARAVVAHHSMLNIANMLKHNVLIQWNHPSSNS